MHLHFGKTDIGVRFAHGARYGKLVEADRPVDFVHIEWRVIERIQLGAGARRYFRDTTDFHCMPRVGSHRTALADLNARRILLLYQFDQRFEHARIGRETRVRRDRDDRVDFDHHFVAWFYDVRHAAHRLIGDIADHGLDEIQLLARILGRFAEVGVAMSDAYGCLFRHSFSLLRRTFI